MVSIVHLLPADLPTTPRRVLKYLLVYCRQGALHLSIDETEYRLSAGQAVTVTSGQMHAFTAVKGHAVLLDFTLDFFCKFDDDIELVRENYREQPAVKDYAARLGTTEAKLNERSKIHTGKTAQNVVFSLTVSEAKRLLRYHDLSVKEIAARLGFADPFYFSNFFKKHTGASPATYRAAQPG